MLVGGHERATRVRKLEAENRNSFWPRVGACRTPWPAALLAAAAKLLAHAARSSMSSRPLSAATISDIRDSRKTLAGSVSAETLGSTLQTLSREGARSKALTDSD